MGDPVVYFEIIGADGPALRDFYSGLFGWTIDAVEGTEGGYHRIHQEPDGIAGGLGAFPGAPGTVTFYVRTDDLDAAVRKANDLGGRTVMPPRAVSPGIETAWIADPEGHVIGLIKGL